MSKYDIGYTSITIQFRSSFRTKCKYHDNIFDLYSKNLQQERNKSNKITKRIENKREMCSRANECSVNTSSPMIPFQFFTVILFYIIMPLSSYFWYKFSNICYISMSYFKDQHISCRKYYFVQHMMLFLFSDSALNVPFIIKLGVKYVKN